MQKWTAFFKATDTGLNLLLAIFTTNPCAQTSPIRHRLRFCLAQFYSHYRSVNRPLNFEIISQVQHTIRLRLRSPLRLNWIPLRVQHLHFWQNYRQTGQRKRQSTNFFPMNSSFLHRRSRNTITLFNSTRPPCYSYPSCREITVEIPVDDH